MKFERKAKKIKGIMTGNLWRKRETKKSMGGRKLPEQMLQRSNVNLRLQDMVWRDCC